MWLLSRVCILFATMFVTSCEQKPNPPRAIFRSKSDERVPRTATKTNKSPEYPWAHNDHALYAVTKEFFRCKGSSLNPPHIIYENGKEKDRVWDCGGIERHGLPVRNNEEYVYPALLEILNFLQSTLQKPLTITSGHRCPNHEQYINVNQKAASSRHLIGAAVSFLIEGSENNPEVVIKQINQYYTLNPLFSGKKEYVEFTRTDTSDTSTQAWVNKEIMIKLYLPTEGRNLDNRHPFPYFDIQVRFDRERNKPVTFSWQEAQTYLRK